MGPGAGRVDLSHATVSRRARRARGLRFVDRGSWDVGRGTWDVGRGSSWAVVVVRGSRFVGFASAARGSGLTATLSWPCGRGVANEVVCRMPIVPCVKERVGGGNECAASGPRRPLVLAARRGGCGCRGFAEWSRLEQTGPCANSRDQRPGSRVWVHPGHETTVTPVAFGPWCLAAGLGSWQCRLGNSPLCWAPLLGEMASISRPPCPRFAP